MKPNFSIFIICTFLLSKNIFAQIPEIRFEKYTTQNGLTQNSTGPLLQDSRGFLWIGTSWGLNRYDGRVIKQYNTIGENGLTDLAITGLAEDKQGLIWISTSNGLSCLDPSTEKFTQYIGGKSPGNLPEGYCVVYADKQNNVWVGTNDDLALFDRQTKTFKIFPVSTVGKDIRINRYICGFLEDSKGRFWVSTSYGIKLFDRSTKTYKSYHFEEINGESQPVNAEQGLFEDKAGNIWAGTWNCGVLKYDEQHDRFVSYRNATENPAQQTVHHINSIVLNNHYYFLLATEGGLLLADPSKIENGELKIEEALPEMEDGNSTILKNKWEIIRDKQDNYWISGASGLLKIDRADQSFQWRRLPGNDFASSIVFHVIPSIKTAGEKVFLTTQKGWWEYDLDSREFSRHVLPKGYEDMLANINRFVPTENGYWFTSQIGAGFYNFFKNEVIDLSPLIPGKNSEHPRTGVIATDDRGRIWFSVFRTGIRVYDPQTKKITSLFADSASGDNLVGKSIFDMKKSPEGKMIFTTGFNVFIVDPNDFSFSKIDVPGGNSGTSSERIGPRKILFDKENRLLILSWQKIYQLQNGKLHQLYPEKGLAGFSMDNFFQDSHGDFWVPTNFGLYKADAKMKTWININDKIPASDFSDVSEVFRSAKDEFILTSIGKIGTFSLHDLAKNNNPPSVIVNRLRTGNSEHYLVSLKQKTWDVSFKDAVEIEVSAINFSNEKSNKIFYKLEGRDEDWKELTGNPVIRYEQLPPDHYTLKVKAVNGDGVSSKDTILSFKVLPPFWRTWWFMGLAIFVTAALLYFFYRYRVRQLIKEERLRSHIATDLHDDIGATLSSISFYSETIKQQTATQLPQLTPLLEKMGETSREMVSNMSDIVWAINPENDSFEKMLSRMQNLAVELCAVKHIELSFIADEKLNQLQLTMEQRRNIFLIFKEALNNALKYADCRNIKIELKKEQHLLVLSVKDDGKGFTEMTTENISGGNGLKNMRSRAKEIDGEIRINAGNKGTTVWLAADIT
jgi:ligand-binding sensor domain-containing protein/two-component sensor histidine kinase